MTYMNTFDDKNNSRESTFNTIYKVSNLYSFIGHSFVRVLLSLHFCKFV